MEKNEKEKIYRIADDPGYVRKIAFIDKSVKAKGLDRLSKIMPFVEEAGNEMKFKGFYASAPTIYRYMDKLNDVEWEPFYRHQGSLYERHHCPHPDIVVYCHIMKLDDYQHGSSAGKFIKDLMSEFGPNKP